MKLRTCSVVDNLSKTEEPFSIDWPTLSRPGESNMQRFELWGITIRRTLNKKIDPVVCLSGFWTKLSRRLSFPRWPRSKIPYLFSLNRRKEVSSPSSKFLSRSSAVNKDHLPKVLHKASPFTKTISKTGCSHLLLPLKVEYEIANNGMQAHWILAVLPKTTFPWWMTCELPYTVLLLLALFHFIRNIGEMITTNSEGFLTS